MSGEQFVPLRNVNETQRDDHCALNILVLIPIWGWIIISLSSIIVLLLIVGFVLYR